MYQYIAFYKPYQVLSQFSPEGDKKTLADYFPNIAKNIYPVGRLDHDSEGLLLLTDDKQLTNRLLNPIFKHERTYWVQVEGTITTTAIEKLRAGVTININGKQYQTQRAKAAIIEEPEIAAGASYIRYRKNIPTSWLALTLTEGKNRQVRRMTATVGYPTLRLIRYAIGIQTIDGLTPGQHYFFLPSLPSSVG